MIRSRRAPEWVKPFYDRKSREAGPSGILPHHRERAEAISRFGGVTGGRVLELGSGAGGSAVATARLGYQVTAVELSPTRVRFSRELALSEGHPDVEVVEGDFMTARLPGGFDAVVMWNGFGVGTDLEQQLLLHRLAEEWLQPRGVVVLDVFNPVAWARETGQEAVDEETGVRQRVDYDPVGSRFVDTWWFDGDQSPPLSQSVRCYAPADLSLLVAQTPLEVVALECEGHALAPGSAGARALASSWGYRAKLARR